MLPIQMFISASAATEDHELCAKLDAILSVLVPGVAVWYRGRAGDAGQEEEAVARLARAPLILLMVSFDYLTSPVCRAETEQAMARHAAGEARVIPISARPCPWNGQPFAKLQALPRDCKPVTSWAVRDDALDDIVRGITQVIQEMIQRLN